MSRILVIYYSSYGHIETLANAVAEGARGSCRQQGRHPPCRRDGTR